MNHWVREAVSRSHHRVFSRYPIKDRDSPLTTTTTETVSRQHHLDAVRAFAMLLGIVLHGALSLGGIPWMVQDLHPNPLFMWLFFGIHGFRMPLFIMVSGYFTMLLWRRRGLKPMLRQRFLRVFIPCMLGLVTIVPALNWATTTAFEISARQDQQRRPKNSTTYAVTEAIRNHDLDALKKEFENKADLNKLDPEFGLSLLGWAGLYGDADIAAWLIDHGADVNSKTKDGFTPLHQAAFLGHLDVLELLIQHGANPLARGPMNDTARDSTKADIGYTKYITGLLRVPLRDEDELQAGRAECRARLSELTGEKDAPETSDWSLDGIRKRYAAFLGSDLFLIRLDPKGEPFHLILTPVFHHLWFLWTLCQLVVIFAIFVVVAEAVSLPRVPRWMVLSPFRLLWLIPITMIPQLLMGVFSPGFGPDTSVGILPQPHVLLYYLVFFGFGAFYYDANDAEGKLGRWWLPSLLASIVIALPAGVVTLGMPVATGLIQAVYAWALTFAIIGLFRRYVTEENKTIRYLSDSAYWLYLVHLPLIVLAQAWVRDWDMSAFVKFTLICACVTALLLISYQLLVRYTWIGRLLNGPRKQAIKVDDVGVVS